MDALPDASRCPLCGAANNCALIDFENSSEQCWCETAKFSDALLASVPEAARNLACICAGCVERFAGDRSIAPEPAQS